MFSLSCSYYFQNKLTNIAVLRFLYLYLLSYEISYKSSLRFHFPDYSFFSANSLFLLLIYFNITFVNHGFCLFLFFSFLFNFVIGACRLTHPSKRQIKSLYLLFTSFKLLCHCWMDISCLKLSSLKCVKSLLYKSIFLYSILVL